MLKIFNDNVAAAEIKQRRMRWQDDHES